MRKFTEEKIQGQSAMMEEIQKKPAEETKKQRAAVGVDSTLKHDQKGIPKEKGFRAWLTRNAVAFCTIFIGVFSVLHLSTWVSADHLTEFLAVPLACTLVSIPLILIRTEHWIMGLAGWFGALSGPFIILLELVGITSQNGRDGSFFLYLVSVYFVDAIILGLIARKGAVRNRLVVPRWEQKIRAWATRNVVAYCTVFIVFLLGLYLFYLTEPFTMSMAVVVSILMVVIFPLISIPLILSEKGGATIRNAGWLGILCIPYVFYVQYYSGIFILATIVLAFFGRKKAKKERSESENLAS